MTPLPAFFISSSKPDPGVFESQVLEVGQLLGELGIEFRYIIIEGLRTWLTSGYAVSAQIDDLRRNFEVSIRALFVPSPTSRLGIRLAGRILAPSVTATSHDRVLLVGRGAIAANVALDIKRRTGTGIVVFDCRADEAAESRLTARSMTNSRARYRWDARADRIEELQRRAGRDADHVLVVSTPLGHRISEASKVGAENTTCIPCCVDTSRFDHPPEVRSAVRKKLGIDDRIVIVYSGSLVQYQIPESVADLLSEVRQHLSDIFLLVLTRDVTRAANVFAALISDGAARIVSAEYEEVGQYLAAADLGILLREDDPVNRVACPVKFGEYQAAGLPVIVTPGIGDVSSYVESTGFGIIVNPSTPVDKQAQWVADRIRATDWSSQRHRIKQAAGRRFSRREYLELYRNILLNMGLPNPEAIVE